jgi:hypothetical protein
MATEAPERVVEKPDWNPSDPLDERIGGPPVIQFPSEWTRSTSWQRAQTKHDHGGPINPAERMVFLDESDSPHRVVFVLMDRTLRAECSCTGWRFRSWCAHVASLWWQWTRAEIAVSHIETGRTYTEPPSWVRVDCRPDESLQALTPAELDAYLHCELGDAGVREWSRHTGRSPGTVGNLLSSARETLPDPHPHAGGGQT